MATTNFPTSGNTTVTDAAGTIHDSGGPGGNYGDNESGSVTISPAYTGDYDYIAITFTAFDTESGVDNLKIYAGTSATDPLLVTLSATPTVPVTYIVESASAFLKFISDSSVGGVGFTCTYEKLESVAAVNFPTGSNLTITHQTASIRDSGGLYSEYGNNETGTVTVSPAYNADNEIDLIFLSFATESGFDDLTIYAGTGSGAPLVSTHTGTPSVPFTVSVTGSASAFLEFSSDGNPNGAGFELHYSVPGPPAPPPHGTQRSVSGSLTRGSTASVTGTIDSYRQGVSVNVLSHKFSGMLLTIGSNAKNIKLVNGRAFDDDVKFDDSFAGSDLRIDEAPSHRLVEASYTRQKSFDDTLPFADITPIKDNAKNYLEVGRTQIFYPSNTLSGSYKLLDKASGIIEPLKVVRGEISYAEVHAHRYTPIVQYVDVKYIGDIPAFVDVNVEKGLIASDNGIYDVTPDKAAFVDIEVPAFIDDIVGSRNFSDILTNNHGTSNEQVEFEHVIMSLSGSDLNPLLKGQTISSPAGFTHRNATNGTDSVAFAGLKR
jgi:hypothetical protein